MANMRMLIRIVFVIFIANRIDCLGSVCDNCCDCFKGGIKEDEEIKENEKIGGEGEEEKKEDEKKEDENITAESLVNGFWLDNKKGLVIMIFKKEKNDNVFTSTENGNEFSFKLDESNKLKKTDQNENKDELKLENKLNLGEKKYALFEIKTEKEKTVYLYCSDVETIVAAANNNNIITGIFQNMHHKSISVIACDTKKVKDMRSMFANCSSLTELNLQNFNTENVTDMKFMFYECSNLTELDLKNFNTTKVFHMNSMFYKCSKLKKLDLKNFDTTNVTSMESMFNGCSSLTDLKCGENFKTEKVINKKKMFSKCSSFPENIRNDLNNVEEIIDFFKKNNPKKIL